MKLKLLRRKPSLTTEGRDSARAVALFGFAVCLLLAIDAWIDYIVTDQLKSMWSGIRLTVLAGAFLYYLIRY